MSASALLMIPWSQFLQFSLPWLLVFAAAGVILLLGALSSKHHEHLVMAIALSAVMIALVLSWQSWIANQQGIGGMMIFDRFSYLGWMFVLLSTLLSILLSHQYVAKRKLAEPEYFALMLFAAFGMGCMVCSGDLLSLFLGIEIMSVAVYCLAGFLRHRTTGNEAALKYFLTGSFASAFLLMGIAFVYGSTGTTDFLILSNRVTMVSSGSPQAFLLLGGSLMLIGFAFKIAAVPFHAWAPDVYEGAPTPITHFMATAVKVAAVFAFIRIGVLVLEKIGYQWINVVSMLALVSMTVGNLAALFQDDLKRMLAYSSISHVGYVLIGFLSLGGRGLLGPQTVIFYMLSYLLMTTGAFAVIVAAQGSSSESTDVSRLAGMSKQHPWMAAMLSLFLLSLTGFPPTLGFFAKYYLFLGAFQGGHIWIVIVALLNSAVSAYYYLRPVVVMYFRGSHEHNMQVEIPSSSLIAVIAFAALAVMFFGLFPNNLLVLVERSMF